MNCTGAGGTATASTVVTVTPKPSVTVKRRAGEYRFRPVCDLNVVRHQCDVLCRRLDDFHGHGGVAERQAHGHHHLYDELHGSGRHRRREYRRHGDCQTQRDC